jgi:hypothetical protein
MGDNIGIGAKLPSWNVGLTTYYLCDLDLAMEDFCALVY